MTDAFRITSPEYAKALQAYLDERLLEPSDFPSGLLPTNSVALLRERGYNAALQAGRAFVFFEYLNAKGECYFEYEEGEKVRPYGIARFLTPPKGWVGDKPPPKGLSPNARPNVLHYEPIADGRSWFDLPEGSTVVHVESMIKAKVVSKWTRIPSIGLNGVRSYSSTKKGIRFLYEDQEIDFSKFRNVVVFDSNTRSNKDVQDAREKLLFKFKHVLGCKDVCFVDLPHSETGETQGPDDYLAATHDPNALIELINNADVYAGGEHSDLLQKMDRALFCTKGGTVVDREDKEVRTTSKARDFYANINEKEIGKGGTVKTIRAFDVWLESPHRNEVVNPAFEYLGDEFVEKRGMTYYNVYTECGPWPTAESERADVSRHLAHLAGMMRPEDLELLRSYLKFLKVTSEKPTSFPVIYSDKRGVGKGWLTKMADRLIGGANTTSADARAFVSNFNAQLANKRLVIINEFKVSGGPAKDAAMNSLKRFFGDEFISVEPKGVDSYQVENKAGMVITSNALEDVPTDGMEDRRMWYVEVHVVPGTGPDEWSYLHKSLDDPAVMNAIFDWVDGAAFVDFSTYRPPLDEARIKAIRRSSSGLDDACSTVLEDLKEEGCVVANWETVQGLLKFHVPKIEDMTPKSIHNALKRTGWAVSEKKYGNTPASRRNVWVLDLDAFYENEFNTKWVASELSKSGALLNSPGGAGDKY